MVPAKEKQKYVLAPSAKKRTMKCFLAAQSHSHSSFIAKNAQSVLAFLSLITCYPYWGIRTNPTTSELKGRADLHMVMRTIKPWSDGFLVLLPLTLFHWFADLKKEAFGMIQDQSLCQVFVFDFQVLGIKLSPTSGGLHSSLFFSFASFKSRAKCSIARLCWG